MTPSLCVQSAGVGEGNRAAGQRRRRRRVLTAGGREVGARMAMIRPWSGPWLTVEVSKPQCCAVRCASSRCEEEGTAQGKATVGQCRERCRLANSANGS